MALSKSAVLRYDFAGSEKLENEFDELYASLFEHPEPYLAIVTALAKKKCGMTRDEVSRESGVENSGWLSRYLKVLEQCGFIRRFTELGKKTKGSVFQLIDNFTLFYFRFVESNRTNDSHYWSSMLDSHVHSTWAGLAFERLCLQHVDGIKRALGISGVLTNVHSWRNGNAQIDLLLDRNDGIINICEMKYWAGPYAMTAEDCNEDAKGRPCDDGDFFRRTAERLCKQRAIVRDSWRPVSVAPPLI